MAAEKAGRRKGTKGAGSGRAGADPWLRQWRDPRSERRFEPKTSVTAIVWTVAGSLGAVAAGAGTFGQWFRAEDAGPHPYAVYLLAGGAVLFAVAAILGGRGARPVRVGDAGLAIERDDSDLERLGWNEITRVTLAGGVLTVQASGRSISLPLDVHGAAAARALSELEQRLPERVADLDRAGVPALDDAAGETLPLEPPQLAGLRCKASGKVIAFERDVRLCGRCGEAYHKDKVPRRCETCDAQLLA